MSQRLNSVVMLITCFIVIMVLNVVTWNAGIFYSSAYLLKLLYEKKH